MTDVHTCHDECPCQTGGEPMPDFLPAHDVAWLLAALERLEEHETRARKDAA